MAVIKSKGFDPMAIPVGKRKVIEDICRADSDYSELFKKPTSFGTAWKKGHHLFKMENHDSSAKRGK